jgi:hypothetical protein
VACCVVAAATSATAPCAVAAPFAAVEEATVMLFCVMGPSLPGLLIRTITTTFIGCCCVAVADESALWPVVDVAVGVVVSAGAAAVGAEPASGSAAATTGVADASDWGRAAAACGPGAASATGAKNPHARSATRAAAPRCNAGLPTENLEPNLDFKA